MNAFAARIDRVAQTPRTVAWLGLVLGTLAFWFALPPVQARAPWVPLLVGLLAMACGIWAVTRGVGRLAWGASAVGAIGIALGILATRSSTDHLD